MAKSDDFYRRCRNGSGVERLEEVFYSLLPYPGQMLTDICNTIRFEIFSDDLDSAANIDSYKSILAALLDLFEMDISSEDSALTKEVLEIIRDSLDEYADELDEDLMTYAFQYILSKGALG